MKMLFRFVVVTTLLVPGASFAQDPRQQLMNHCKAMQSFGETFSRLRAEGKPKPDAWQEASMSLSRRYGIPVSDRLKTVTGIYGLYVDMFPGHDHRTMGFFVLSQCLVTHAMKKTLPLQDDGGREQVNTVLTDCETAHPENYDERGGCILNDLKPLATEM